MKNQPMIITNCDISAQEPTWIILLSKERAYLPTFRNKTIREMKLEVYVDYFFSKKYNFNPEEYSKMSHIYWTWIYNKFSWNLAELKKFNDLVDDFIQGNDKNHSKIVEILDGWISELDNLFEK